MPFKAVHLLGLKDIINADLFSLGVLGGSCDWMDWKMLEQYPSYTVLDSEKGRLFCCGFFDRTDGLREAWVVLTKKAPTKLVLDVLRRGIKLHDPQVACVAGRNEKEHETCKRFLKVLGFKVPLEGVVPTLAREGVLNGPS